MPQFLIDANLPHRIVHWRHPDYIHLKDIDDTWPDKKVWSYTQKHKLTIITKDTDFSARVLVSKSPPKVIHLRVGNMRLKEFKEFIDKNWNGILALHEVSRLVNVYPDRLEGIK